MEVGTIQACEIARIKRQRLNEFIAGGDYTCAPPTVAGKARTFGVNDVIALFIFAREIERGTRPLLAGNLAANALATLADDPGAAVSATAQTSSGRPFIRVPENTLIGDCIGDEWIVSLTHHNLAQIRSLIVMQMAPDHETGELIG